MSSGGLPSHSIASNDLELLIPLLYVQSTGITNIQHYALVHSVLGIALMLARQTLYQLGYTPNPRSYYCQFCFKIKKRKQETEVTSQGVN